MPSTQPPIPPPSTERPLRALNEAEAAVGRGFGVSPEHLVSGCGRLLVPSDLRWLLVLGCVFTRRHSNGTVTGSHGAGSEVAGMSPCHPAELSSVRAEAGRFLPASAGGIRERRTAAVPPASDRGGAGGVR